MLKTTGLSVVSAFRVDDDEIDSGASGARAGRSIVKQKVGSIVHNHPKYPENEEGVQPFLRSQIAGLIAKEAPTNVPAIYCFC